MSVAVFVRTYPCCSTYWTNTTAMKCTPAKAIIAVAVLGMVFCLVILIVCSSEWPAPEFFFSMMFLFYFYPMMVVMVRCGFLQLWIEVCYKWIPISGTVKRLSTVTFCDKTTYWAHVTYQMVAEKEADSLAEDDETEPNSSTFSEEDGMEEDAPPAPAHDNAQPAPGVFFWKKMQIPQETYEELCQTDYIMTRQPFPMQVPLNRPQDAETRVPSNRRLEGPSWPVNLAYLMALLYWTAGVAICGYFGVIFPLQHVFHIMKNDDDDDTDGASPWYIVAAYFALPMFFMVGCLADPVRGQTGPVFGIVSSEDEDDADALTAITRTKQMKNLRGGGEDDSVEKMSTTTTTTTSTITSAETENDVADVDLWC